MNKDNSDSSIFLSETAVKVCELPAIFLHNKWNIGRGIDAESYFSKVNNVELYRGEKSGIEFFRPSNIAGDELFTKSSKLTLGIIKKINGNLMLFPNYLHRRINS